MLDEMTNEEQRFAEVARETIGESAEWYFKKAKKALGRKATTIIECWEKAQELYFEYEEDKHGGSGRL